MIDKDFLKELTEIPSVATACGPVIQLLSEHLSSGYNRTLVDDGFCLFVKKGTPVNQLKTVFVSHIDEIGGCSTYERAHGVFFTRFWGNAAQIFAGANLQAYDYLSCDVTETFAVESRVESMEQGEVLLILGDGIRPYRTAWTFKEETIFDGDVVEGKALDPRATNYAAIEAVGMIDSQKVGLLFVMAEECSDVARKAVEYLRYNAPNLQYVINADVPGINNIERGSLDRPVIRIFEGRNLVDPTFGIRVTEICQSRGLEFELSGSKSGSQTGLFIPIAKTISVALPSEGVHLPRVKMSLKGIERTVALLKAIGEETLWGKI